MAGLFTPKVIYAAAGAALGSALASAASAERARFGVLLRSLGWIALGVSTAAGIAALEMAREGILRGFLVDAVGTSLRMRIDDPAAFRLHYIQTTLQANPVSGFWRSWVSSCANAVGCRRMRVGFSARVWSPDSSGCS